MTDWDVTFVHLVHQCVSPEADDWFECGAQRRRLNPGRSRCLGRLEVSKLAMYMHCNRGTRGWIMTPRRSFQSIVLALDPILSIQTQSNTRASLYKVRVNFFAADTKVVMMMPTPTKNEALLAFAAVGVVLLM